MTKGKSPSKKHEDGKEPKESGLATPTSITMQTSFIIKNADDSFDAYHQQMKKRKMGGGHMGDGTMQGSMGPNSGTMGGGLGSDINYGVVHVSPSARDGHSSDISRDGVLFVFGGDRHLMPFNDLYVMSLSN